MTGPRIAKTRLREGRSCSAAQATLSSHFSKTLCCESNGVCDEKAESLHALLATRNPDGSVHFFRLRSFTLKISGQKIACGIEVT